MSHVLKITSVGPPFAHVLARVHAECFTGADRWNRDAFDTLLRLDGVQAWCAFEGRSLMGFLLVRICLDACDILTIGVRPACRRKNVGGSLLDFALKFLRDSGVKKVFLEVSTGNQTAIHLYKRKNFRPNGLRKNYYSDSSDALSFVYEFLMTS